MEIVLLSLYSGSLFFILSVAAPVLLRTEKNKNTAGSFYGRMLRRFYKIAFFLLLVYLISGRIWEGTLLLFGLSLNLATSMWLMKYKRRLGNIEDHSFSSPQRLLFRRVSYLSTFLLLINFLISTTILLKEVR